ncbi:toprim domain-containing protein [Pseudochrobactrum sp. XF203]|uniref:DUF7146 domain-containing protein n=1 Tax=Pseudochrobactrum sp. XF203 TaxID=2879116 RepID=UPI001CE2C035|nr:toprim domain-containing protein [Pseudochrobactrum sp. XF203]UCA46889.1 toprim domain-containing protein [Pseudochrobactrum sp. XF203]
MNTSARTITKALNGHWHGRYGICLCPAHFNTKSPALSISDGYDGRLLLRCHAGCDFLSILEALKCLGLVAGSSNYAPPSTEEMEVHRLKELEKVKRQEARALQCWSMTKPLQGTLAETYLRSRGVTCLIGDILKFHPSCWHPSGQQLPAMVALVEGAERFSIHRTYLSADGMGKALVEPAKAMLGSVSGGAVRLSGGTDRLIVCEGIETGLSLLSGLVRGSVSVCAALSTSGMKALSLPDKPAELTIATDGDDAGRQAGHSLAERASALGWQVSMLPAPDGRDWNDILTMKGGLHERARTYPVSA